MTQQPQKNSTDAGASPISVIISAIVSAFSGAFDELASCGVAVGMNEPDTVSIDQIELAYNSLSGAYQEEYPEPVYVFKLANRMALGFRRWWTIIRAESSP